MQNLQQLGAAALPQLQQIAGQITSPQLGQALQQLPQLQQVQQQLAQQVPQMLQQVPQLDQVAQQMAQQVPQLGQVAQQGQQMAQQIIGQQMAKMMPRGIPMPFAAPQGGHALPGAACPKCDRGSRVMVYISLLTLAILLLVFASVQSFGWSLMWFIMLLIGYAACTGIFL